MRSRVSSLATTLVLAGAIAACGSDGEPATSPSVTDPATAAYCDLASNAGEELTTSFITATESPVRDDVEAAFGRIVDLSPRFAAAAPGTELQSAWHDFNEWYGTWYLELGRADFDFVMIPIDARDDLERRGKLLVDQAKVIDRSWHDLCGLSITFP